jgi:hypothetical protein
VRHHWIVWEALGPAAMDDGLPLPTVLSQTTAKCLINAETTAMAGIRQRPPERGKRSAGCAVPSTRTLTGGFSLKYPSSPLPRGFFERRIMNKFRRNSARILALQKECHAQKNRSAQ